ncbi:helix-hairpin-helix domain-containing protein [Paenalcaligenes niemegkensis]|uniref:ComEA family DNA-binding protein n=1 Tax=Paenalcaligenes niemegkensis TaxID=2895469 RepID=UPI001EE7819E|nr:helix-hairpin-helix domain-containing protein [Paenalcaligenes niemegkensis]MCQ9616792.1 helix-hairpin-helix domain-containing protein [Paenalcaligenes niemegkensis]
MNPFTHSVLAKPLSGCGAVWSTAASPLLSSSPLPTTSAPEALRYTPYHTVPLRIYRNDFRQSPHLFRQEARSRSLWLRLVVAFCGLAVAGSAGAIELNTADVIQLQSLKGIGPKTAALIVEERERGGPFDDAQDLGERVKGLGPKKLSGLLREGLKVSAPAKGKAAPVANASAKKPVVSKSK